MFRNRVLLVEDDPSVRLGLGAFLRAQNLVVEEAETCAEALAAFRANRPDVVVADYSLPDGNSLELLAQMKKLEEDVPVIILTAHGSIDLAVRAIKEGAEQFLTKPVESQALLILVKRLLEQGRLRQRQAVVARQAKAGFDPFLGRSAIIQALEKEARLVVGWDSPILILGETGSGKGVLAKWLHRNGPRADQAFVNLNCAGLSKELLDSELFGYERGAFTGAVASKQGLLEVGHKGIVFLDEIGDMDPAIQPKLLKALEEKTFRRLGDVRDRTVDIRLVASTNLDLQDLVRQRRFRDDLYFRISTLTLRIPPLRERTQDLPAIAAAILDRLCARMGRPAVEMAPDVWKAMAAYAWPGNLRELHNVLERALIRHRGDTLTTQDLDLVATPRTEVPEAGRPTNLKAAEREHIAWVLRLAEGNVGEAAAQLGIARRTLYDKLKNLGIPVREE